MAGDWIKIEHSLPGKPEVMKLAELLSISENEVLGALLRLWIWADQHASVTEASRSCHVASVTVSGIERVTGVTGLVAALETVGWCVAENGGLSLPNYVRHNGKTAKQRALSLSRQHACRARRDEGEKPVTPLSRSERDTCVTREEKRREIHTPPSRAHTCEGAGAREPNTNTEAAPASTAPSVIPDLDPIHGEILHFTPEQHASDTFMVEWGNWCQYLKSRGEYRFPTLRRHLSECENLGVDKAIDAIRNGILRGLKFPAMPFETASSPGIPRRQRKGDAHLLDR